MWDIDNLSRQTVGSMSAESLVCAHTTYLLGVGWSISGDLTTQVKDERLLRSSYICTCWTQKTHFILWYLDMSLLGVTYTRQQVQMAWFLSPVLWQLPPYVFAVKEERVRQITTRFNLMNPLVSSWDTVWVRLRAFSCIYKRLLSSRGWQG